MAVQFVLDAVRRRVEVSQALALAERLELPGASEVAMALATSLRQAVASGAATDIVLDEEGRGELARALDEASAEVPLDDDLRWLYMAVLGERLPWEFPKAGK